MNLQEKNASFRNEDGKAEVSTSKPKSYSTLAQDVL